MPSLIQAVEAKYKKRQIVKVHSGDTVAVHQKIKEGNKERVQVFEGTVIRTTRPNSLTVIYYCSSYCQWCWCRKIFCIASPQYFKSCSY